MSMNEPLENLYFNWLCAKVMPNGRLTPSNSYLTLLRLLHSTEFVWVLSGDDNRAEDGKELRKEFILMADIPDDPKWRMMGCSLLEMFVAFARRAEFQTDDPVENWFWEFMENLKLKQYNDAVDMNLNDIDEILTQFIWRTYGYNGHGGMFPLEDPHTDQRELEIWYQFCSYLVDQDRLP
jgi:hypothetical protein